MLSSIPQVCCPISKCDAGGTMKPEYFFQPVIARWRSTYALLSVTICTMGTKVGLCNGVALALEGCVV